MDTTNMRDGVCLLLTGIRSEDFGDSLRIVLRTGLLKPRRRAMCRRDYDRGGELRRISTHTTKSLKKRLDWI
jgi:hypothetical protein